jgi:hypothetical protein
VDAIVLAANALTARLQRRANTAVSKSLFPVTPTTFPPSPSSPTLATTNQAFKSTDAELCKLCATNGWQVRCNVE